MIASIVISIKARVLIAFALSIRICFMAVL